MRIDVRPHIPTAAWAGKVQLRKSESAFAMAEVVVGIAVTAVLFAAIYTGLAFGFDLLRITRENLRATQVLQQKTETIRLYSWTQVTNTTFVPTNFVEVMYPLPNAPSGLTFTGTVSITSSPISESYSNDLRLITIKLGWLSGKVVRSRQTQTLVARYGLQNYIY